MGWDGMGRDGKGWDGTGGGLLFYGVSRGHSARTKADLRMFGIEAHLCMPSMGPFVDCMGSHSLLPAVSVSSVGGSVGRWRR